MPKFMNPISETAGLQEHREIRNVAIRGSMNGAESLVRILVASGVNTCFANPGTTEMHLVAALDRVPMSCKRKGPFLIELVIP
jgi:hypothetical protein